MNKIQVIVRDKELYRDALPMFATPGSAAVDLKSSAHLMIPPGESKVIDTGISIWIGNVNFAGLILPRSSLGLKGLVLANQTGLIDSDYQGFLKVALYNQTKGHTFDIPRGERIAQFMLIVVSQFSWNIVEKFTDLSQRADGGFGSTGK